MTKSKSIFSIIVSLMVVFSISINSFAEDWNHSGGDNPIYTLNSPVGIGTDTPQAGLQVLNGILTDAMVVGTLYETSLAWYIYNKYCQMAMYSYDPVSEETYSWGIVLSPYDNGSTKGYLRFKSSFPDGGNGIEDSLLTLAPKGSTEGIGKVGIGTTLPTERLDVVGNVKVSGDIDVVNKINTNCNGSICIGNCGTCE